MPPIDLSNAWKSGARIINGGIALLPNFVLAIVVFALFLILASASKSLTRRFTMRRRTHRGVALLISRLVQTSIVVLGFLIALSVVAPSFQAADLIKMLGIGSVAVGFAFQNILQNFLAGILILISEPFQLGDLISVTGIEGNVEDIQARATVVTTKDGRQVVIPNAVLFTNPVAVAAASQSGSQ
ncbi:MAG: mechanosensitive ion channel domain-containing protein [Candidatus Acidiferrales bacterium]